MQGDEPVVLYPDPYGEPLLLGDHVTEDATFLSLEALASRSQLLNHHWRDDRSGQQLRVGMVERGARLLTFALEDENVSKSSVSLKVP
jgi:hypothetical protein